MRLRIIPSLDRQAARLAGLALGTLAALSLSCAVVLAQGAPPPPQLEPLPELPPPPPGQAEPGPEPQVTVVQRDGVTIEETRIRGRLVLVKVTPLVGRPYFLIDETGEGRFIRRESHETGLRVPFWVLFTF